MPILFFLLLILPALSAQEAPYFQQRVDYRIRVSLDDRRHQLNGHLELDYYNNSPDVLDTLVFHCWPRAYRNDATAFATQQRLDGDNRFHFREEDERGDLDSLDFRVAGQPVDFVFDERHPDIGYLLLPEPLRPGKQLNVSTPFRVKIPASFSRLGHVGESYQITQWFPKPAVYDRDGWHPMAYLDRGEFYADFGNFTVDISLPANYRVAATGNLETVAERDWLVELDAATRLEMADEEGLATGYVDEAFPPSDPEVKTLRFRADNVHDFAWFADKRFRVLHAETGLPGGQTVDVWSFFTATEAAYWRRSVDYMARALRFFSERLGPYPYPQMTGVQSALSAGGGMEYPTITVIGRNPTPLALDEVLAHEVAHNWFQGVLATNERDHPWMDEGLASYYEQRYLDAFYPPDAGRPRIFGHSVDYDYLGYHYAVRRGENPAPALGSEGLSSINYWIGAYSLPELGIRHLESIYGVDAIDRAMNRYFLEWGFRHPGPVDFRSTLEAELDANLGWFFEGLIREGKTFDPRIKAGAGRLTVTNRGELNVPLLARSGDTTVLIDRYPAQLSGGNWEVTPSPLGVRPQNAAGKRITDGRLFIGPERPGYRSLFLGLLPGFNVHDGFQLAPFLHNRTLEPQSLEFILASFYGFRSSHLHGYAGLRWRMPDRWWRTNTPFRRPILSLDAKQFSHRTFGENNFVFSRFSGRFDLSLMHPVATGRSSSLSARLISLGTGRPNFSIEGEPLGEASDHSLFLSLRYRRQKRDAINPRRSAFHLEYGDPGGLIVEPFLKLTATLEGGYQYGLGQWINWRLFGGYFPVNPLRDRNLTPDYALRLIDNAAADYRYDGIYAGRNTNQSVYDQQLGAGQGGFRAPISSAFPFGASNDYLAAINLDAQLPFVPSSFPLGVYLDAGNYGATPISRGTTDALQWVGGFSLTALDGRIGLFAPLTGSPEVRDRLAERGGILNRLVLRVDFGRLWPWRVVDEMSF